MPFCFWAKIPPSHAPCKTNVTEEQGQPCFVSSARQGYQDLTCGLASCRHVQWRAVQTALLPVDDVKWGHFEREKMTLKMLPASYYLKYLFEGFRSFNIVNMGSVGQRASKLLAVKVGGLKKKFAIWPRPLLNQSARVRLRLGSNLSQSLTDINFTALCLRDPIFTGCKDLNLLKRCY